jgi:hypothetical protein
VFSIHFDDREFRQLARRLRREAPKALKYAARNSLNRAAFDARKQWQREMQTTFVLRNRWTVGSIRVEKVRGLNIDTMESRVGSLADYMKTQEEGGTLQGKGKHGYRRPTKRAKPPRRLLRPRFKMERLELTRPDLERYGSTEQKIAVATRQAYAQGAKFVFLDISQEGRGIYQVMGSKRRPHMRLIWDMSRDSIKIREHPTLKPAFDWADRRFRRYAKAELLRQLKRARLA